MMIRKNDSPSLSEEQSSILEIISDSIANTKSMASVAIDCDLQDYNPNIIRRYCGVMDELLTRAEISCERLISTFHQEEFSKEHIHEEILEEV